MKKIFYLIIFLLPIISYGSSTGLLSENSVIPDLTRLTPQYIEVSDEIKGILESSPNKSIYPFMRVMPAIRTIRSFEAIDATYRNSNSSELALSA